ncbi:MAG TPA: S9 family peptidase [Longimicrobiales bacterium]|nr:S9 family peptidase [Longimicrobiales bacterium]
MRYAARLRVVMVACVMYAPAVSHTAAQTVPPPPASDRLTLDDFLNWTTVAEPQLSPDGRQIIYTRGWIDAVNDRRATSLHVMNADGTRPRALLAGSSPRWSPDGTRVAYLAQGEPGGTQLWVRYMDAEGASTQITRVSGTPSAIAWSPDGEWLAFRMLVPADAGWRVESQATRLRPKSAKWTEAPRVVEKLVYRRDGIGFAADGVNQVFVVRAAGGTARQLTTGEWDVGSPMWSPDGRTIYFSSGPRVEDAEYEWRESEVYAVDVASAGIRQLTDRRGPDANPVPSPDGRLIAYTGYDRTTDTWVDSRLYVMNADGSGSRVLADIDRSPGNLAWAADNSGVYFTAQNEGSQNLWFAPLRGQPRQVTQGAHMLAVTGVNRDGTAVATRTSFHEPGDIVSLNVRSPDRMRKLTDVNGDILAGKRLGEVEEIWYASSDGLRIQGWVIKPPAFDPARRYPLMLTIHGGPHSMYNVGFNFAWQEHAANDYVVLYTNPRGSTGYGSEFGNAIKNAYPGMDYDDLMAGVDEVIRRGYVDSDNMFVYGCSGGGVLTAWIVGHTDRFAAASANCPVTNWLSFVGTTDGATWYRNFEKFPWEDPSEHLRRSPLMYVGNVKTPTMLMTGVNDLRTPMSQTEEYYQALRVLRVPTAMVRFNDEWHGTSSKPSNFIRTQLYLRDWFERHSREAERERVQ